MRMRTWRNGLGLAVCLCAAVLLAGAAAQKKTSAEELLGAALHQQEVEGNLERAIALYKKALAEAGANRALAARALVRMGRCYEKLGNTEARKAYERILSDYRDQAEPAAEARTRLAALGREPASPPVQTVRQVLPGAWPNGGTCCAFAPNRLIGDRGIVVSDAAGGVQLMDLRSGQSRTLLRQDPQTNVLAAWGTLSPDGKTVAYARCTVMPSEQDCEVRAVGSDGADDRLLFRGPETNAYTYPLQWTHDSTRLFVLGGQTSAVFSIAAAGGDVRMTTKFKTGYAASVALSPDNRFLAYATSDMSAGAKSADIYVIPAGGGTEVAVVQHSAHDTYPVWSPDGRWLLFASDRSGIPGLWGQAVENGYPKGEPLLLRASMGNFVPLGITRSGTLFYGLSGSGSNVYIAGIEPGTGAIVQAPKPIGGRTVGNQTAPAWSCDGKWLSYQTVAWASFSGQFLGVMPAEGGPHRTFPLLFGIPVPARCLPGSNSLVVLPRNPARTDLLQISLENGEVSRRPFMYDGLERNTATWALAREGSRMYGIGADQAVYSVKLADHTQEAIFRFEKQQTPPLLRLSGNESQVAIRIADAAAQKEFVKVFGTRGEAPRDVFSVEVTKDPPRIVAMEWLGDSALLLAVRQAADSLTVDLLYVPVNGAAPKPLGITASTTGSGVRSPFSVAPGGKRIAFTVMSNKPDEVWTLENFLPSNK